MHQPSLLCHQSCNESQIEVKSIHRLGHLTKSTDSSFSKTLDVDDAVLDTLRELSKIPPGAKAWRGPVSDAFNDNRFFNSTPEVSQKWRSIIRALLDSDRQALPELLGNC